MRNSALLKWTQNVSNKSGKENKNWIHPPETLQKGHIAYVVKFLGSVEVDQPKGFNVVREAVRKLRFTQQIKKSSEGTKLPKVELTISIDGITIQDPKTKTIMHQYPLYRISYCADDKVDRQFISFIVKEQDSEQHTCFVFLSDKLSEEITITIGQAFELAYKSSANKPNKLSFRARQLDVSKPMPIYMSEDLSDLAEATEIKRAVPQMPTGMEKDEECEHHLQRAIVTGTVIPTPDVDEMETLEMYNKTYPRGFVLPKQLVRMHPFALEQECAEYDADSEDEEWLNTHGKALNIYIDKFEAIIDKLDKNSTFSVITLPESKALLKESEDVVTAVYDYWLSKRLRLQHSLIPTVKTEAGLGPANDPYIAFRRRKDKMQTRKNRKNDETSYEKMLKLKKDLNYVYALFQMVQKRENVKLQSARLHMEIYQRRYELGDYSGSLLNEVKSLKRAHMYASGGGALAHLGGAAANSQLSWSQQKAKELKKLPLKQLYLDESPKKEKRHYKKRKRNRLANGYDASIVLSSDEEKSESSPTVLSSSDENPFSFKRQKNCAYLAPAGVGGDSHLPWDYELDEMYGDENRRFYSAYVTMPRLRSVGFVRRRVGRGGRVLIDRSGYTEDDVWSKLDYSVKESGGELPKTSEFLRYKPKSPPRSASSSDEASDEFWYDESDETISSPRPLIEVENLMMVGAGGGGSATSQSTLVEIELNSPLKKESTYAILERMAATGGGAARLDASGSILERWSSLRKGGGSAVAGVPYQRKNFYLGPDADTVGCSAFKTSSDDYFDMLFGYRSAAAQADLLNGGVGGGSGASGGAGAGAGSNVLTDKANVLSVSSLLSDCEPQSIRELLLRKS